MLPLMRLYDLRTESAEQIRTLLRRTVPEPSPEMEAQVRTIGARVRSEGDSALLAFTRQWDCPNLTHLSVSDDEFDRAYQSVSPALLEAIRVAIARVERFHRAYLPTAWWLAEPEGGWLGQKISPLRCVGLYVPGGRARYPSSVIMNAVPARVAGVDEIVLCTPPQPDGELPASVLVACRELGIRKVFKIGGAQAIFALAYGTETVPAVEKIVGPGNWYVNLAKRLVWGHVGVDFWAGPSEVAILADASANPEWVASDLLTQLEHGTESVGYLLSDSETVIHSALQAIERQMNRRQRYAILQHSLAHSLALVCPNLRTAVEWINEIAPEHLSLMVADPHHWLNAIRCAGAIFLGHHTPQSVGDYLAGPSHTLPTGRTARFESPLSVETFLRRSSVIALSADAVARLLPYVQTLAHEEGFDGHADAVTLRTEGDILS